MLNEVMIANKNYATIVVEDKGNLDKIAIQVIRYDCPSFLLPIRLVSIDNEVQLRYEIIGGIRMAYMPMQMRKNELNKLLQQLLMPYTDCADWFLDFHNIFLDRNYIMVDQNDLKVKYVYMPYKKMTQTEEQIMKFFGDLVMDVELQDDQAYITTLLRCIMGKNASVVAFANLIKEELKTEETLLGNNSGIVVQMPSQTPAQIPMASSQVSANEKEPSRSNVSEAGKEFGVNDLASSIGTGLFGENEKSIDKKANKKQKENKNFFGKLLGSDKKSKKETVSSNEISNAGSTNAIKRIDVGKLEKPVEIQSNVEMGDFKTEIFCEEEVASGMLRLRLEHAQIDNVPNVIDLDMRKGYAVIGRYDKTGRLSADFNFDMSLTFIGRRHARFELSGDDLYIIDLESKNHTYLNNEELLPNRRYLVHKGDRIALTQKYSIIYQVC